MSRSGRIRVLGEHDLAHLPAFCGACPLGPHTHAEAESSWAAAAVARFGFCGVAVVDRDQVVGYLLVSPALNVPSTHPIAHGPRTPDSAVVMSVRVLEPYHRVGYGKHLVQAVAARLVRQAGCLEAAGATGGRSCQIPPRGWLEGVGFAPCDEAPTLGGVVRMRLDLESTVAWRPDLRWALDLVDGLVSRPAQPEHPRVRQ